MAQGGSGLHPNMARCLSGRHPGSTPKSQRVRTNSVKTISESAERLQGELEG